MPGEPTPLKIVTAGIVAMLVTRTRVTYFVGTRKHFGMLLNRWMECEHSDNADAVPLTDHATSIVHLQRDHQRIPLLGMLHKSSHDNRFRN